jgi:hypothetical protein
MTGSEGVSSYANPVWKSMLQSRLSINVTQADDSAISVSLYDLCVEFYVRFI